MDDFEVLVRSFGEHAVDYIGKDNLASLTVFGEPALGAAHVEVCLEQNDWATQSFAIEKMIELRGMFIDELSIDYRFVEADDDSRETIERSTYAYA